MGIEIDLAILKEGEEVNKHLLCGICFMILEDPVQCVRLVSRVTQVFSPRARAVSAASAWTFGKPGSTSAPTAATASSKLRMSIA